MAPEPDAERTRPWLIWCFLAFLCGAVFVTRGHDSAWPMIGWLMYWRVGDVPEELRTIRIDVTTADGDRMSIFPSEPLTHAQRPLAENVMWQAFSSSPAQEASRRFLVGVLENYLSLHISTVEAYAVEWDVPSLPNLRRIDRDKPDREVALGSFIPE